MSATGLDYQALFQHAPCGYLLTDDGGVITEVNETFLTWGGYSRAELLHTPLHALLPAGDQLLYTRHCVPQLTLTGAVAEFALEVIGQDGSRRAALLSANRVPASGTTPAMVRVGIFGAHQRLRYEKSLLDARRRAEESEARRAAAEAGLIRELGAWVLDEAVAQAVRWAAEQPARGPVEMAVNLSTRQLADPELPRRVGAVLARHGFNPSLLTLEITETSLMVGPEAAMIALGALKSLGVGLAVDDFGTGYSSLTYLRQFPIDELKIDRTFVSGLGINSGDSAIVASCVQLAHAVGIKAVAEGVETEGQREALIGLNCDLAQGYHSARPLPAAELASWFAMESAERTQSLPGAAAL